jgi:hypothetical protein
MAKALQANVAYNSSEVKTILENLELLTHKTTEEAQKMLNSEGKHKAKRMEKMNSLV